MVEITDEVCIENVHRGQRSMRVLKTRTSSVEIINVIMYDVLVFLQFSAQICGLHKFKRAWIVESISDGKVVQRTCPEFMVFTWENIHDVVLRVKDGSVLGSNI